MWEQGRKRPKPLKDRMLSMLSYLGDSLIVAGTGTVIVAALMALAIGVVYFLYWIGILDVEAIR